jgi:hypothetical protein
MRAGGIAASGGKEMAGRGVSGNASALAFMERAWPCFSRVSVIIKGRGDGYTKVRPGSGDWLIRRSSGRRKTKSLEPGPISIPAGQASWTHARSGSDGK